MEKSLEDYMNDPDIINEPMPLREIHAIRFMLADKNRGLTFEERQKRADEIIEKSGLSHLVVKSTELPH